MSAPAPWPRAVLAAPIFRGLDARALREIEDAGRLVERAAGEALYRAGERGDAFYVLAEGELEIVERRRGDGARVFVRKVDAGGSAGEEVAVGGVRRHDAVARTRLAAAEVPVHLFRRAAGRVGGASAAEALERTLRRAASIDLLRSSMLGGALPDEAFDALVDASTWQEVPRGQAIYRAGDPSTSLYVVADGLVQIQSEEEGRAHVRAYLGRGDFFGDEELEDASSRATSAIASGPSTVVAIPARLVRRIAEDHGDPFAARRRVDGGGAAARVRDAAAGATAHAFRDLYRLSVARSLLVIDLETCVRCGHCTWSCGALHGTPRLARRGDKVVTRLRVLDEAPPPPPPADAPRAAFDVFRMRPEDVAAPKPLLLPNSCQHCEHPACMVDCPTGAIGRDPRGEVFIREALCTGCGACARACPWHNIQMSARPAGTARPEEATADLVATKCDLCRTHAGGPACVEACPVGAILRVDPAVDFAEVAEVLAPRASPGAPRTAARAPMWPLVTGAGIAAAAIGAVGQLMHARGQLAPSAGAGLAAGFVAAGLLLALLAYAAPKRGVTRRARRVFPFGRSAAPSASGERPATSRVRAHYVVHLVLGLLTIGAMLAHAPALALPATSGGAALTGMWLATVSGVFTALAYALVPRRLARLETQALLPEDFAQARAALERRTFQALSGRSDLVKKVFETILQRYASAPWGPLAIVLGGRDLRAERRTLAARVERRLEGRGGEKLAGLDELVRLAVEHRALGAQRWLGGLLGALLPLHVVSFAMAVVLVAFHVIAIGLAK